MTEITERPLISIVVGSVRPVRIGDQIAEAIAPIIAEASGARVQIIDLAELNLPMLDEPLMPAMGNYTHAHTKAWSEIIAGSDSVVFLTPQYNGGYPAALKNAIDYLYAEWKAQPALIVSYGGHGGGQAAAQLQQVLDFIGLNTAAGSVEITIPRDGYGTDWRLVDAEPIVAVAADALRAASATLTENALVH
ncbi:NADPH-dependent FMN reductase [Leucobacter salsicius]|uniref:NADPH-dependent FMN reductase n=1 Tax=Leucobacter salsicius TaxID=664638 RepID=UPI0003465510|nr:NADPH-dependent FMN reductase [Leucobacter salsicius]